MANIEVLVIDWLNTFVGVPVSGEIPAERPDQFITVDRTGGPRESMVLDRAEILIEFYDRDSRLNASNFANLVGDKIVELEAYDQNITHAAINSMNSLDDLIGGFKRYQLWCDVYYRR